MILFPEPCHLIGSMITPSDKEQLSLPRLTSNPGHMPLISHCVWCMYALCMVHLLICEVFVKCGGELRRDAITQNKETETCLNPEVP